MKNIKIGLPLTVLLLSSCNSYKGVFDSTSYMDKCNASTDLKIKQDMKPNISNKHKLLYVKPHIDPNSYTNPDISKSRAVLPKYRAYLKLDTNSSYEKAKSALLKLQYNILKENKANKYLVIQAKNNEKYTIVVEEFNKGSIVYIMNKQHKIVLQSEFKELFDLI